MNKNFSNLKLLSLLLKSKTKIDFSNDSIIDWDMFAIYPNFSNIQFEYKSIINSPYIFELLEVLCIESWTLNKSIDWTILLEIPKLKSISISKTPKKILNPLLNEENKTFSW